MSDEASLNLAMRWLIFIKERFEPFSHLAMIALFVAGHWAMVAMPHVIFVPRSVSLLTFFGTLTFFFKLRLYDEIKDYETDIAYNPTRPLPRGLLGHRHLYLAIGTCISAEILFFGIASPNSLQILIPAIAYSLLMYKEFFIPSLIRPKLTTYAVMHTVVTVLLSMTIFSALTNATVYNLSHEYLYFALMSWMLFNIFEFGRKTFTDNEERDQVPSYSNVWGRYGAVILLLSQSIIMTILLLSIELFDSPFMKNTLIGINISLLIIGLLYGKLNRPPWGGIYRAFSSLYIILIYAIIIANYGIYRS